MNDKLQWLDVIIIPRDFFFSHIVVLKYFVNLIHVLLLSRFGCISVYLE